MRGDSGYWNGIGRSRTKRFRLGCVTCRVLDWHVACVWRVTRSSLRDCSSVRVADLLTLLLKLSRCAALKKLYDNHQAQKLVWINDPHRTQLGVQQGTKTGSTADRIETEQDEVVSDSCSESNASLDCSTEDLDNEDAGIVQCSHHPQPTRPRHSLVTLSVPRSVANEIKGTAPLRRASSSEPLFPCGSATTRSAVAADENRPRGYKSMDSVGSKSRRDGTIPSSKGTALGTLTNSIEVRSVPRFRTKGRNKTPDDDNTAATDQRLRRGNWVHAGYGMRGSELWNLD